MSGRRDTWTEDMRRSDLSRARGLAEAIANAKLRPSHMAGVRGIGAEIAALIDRSLVVPPEHSIDEVERLREALTKIIDAHDEEAGFAFGDDLERFVLAAARDALAASSPTSEERP